MSWEESSDFVLAYMVRMVKVSKDGKLGRNEDYKNGAMLDEHDTATMQAADLSRPELHISSVDLSASQVGDGFAVEETTEDEQLVVCAIPQSSA
jgi:hypothetical protein